ncbi:L-proline dehydrogenase [Halobacillus karajensis]|uniref:proline dehydrogenase n=1 Tax=Halobacillus karajensis TaxID=195088 RepID=A0A059NYQ9_9BACI|nr:Proline dehydrogenase 1 [Halobacillus karajensis]CDQ23376.1 Proline dehydrogenase 1 [Halobacillus karajensis]CDQ26858.1 Proline dehydrogenase 1 [Halobacillus karajensis]SEH50015.1 L-proline dehydrogenase [Halobacillus karajensis]
MVILEAISKNFFLYLSNNKLLDRFAKRFGSNFGADKIVGGETFSQAIPLIQQLNYEGLVVTVDHLGEFVDSEEESRDRAGECIRCIQQIASNQLQSEVSLKLTSLGLDISHELVMENMELILKEAQKYNVTITIDMEDSSRCGATLEIYKELKKDYPNLGTVVQSYLYRSNEDLDDLNDYQPYLRLVKGAYKESGKVAFPEKKLVDDNLKHLIKKNLLNGNYTAIASHDDAIIDYTKQLVKEHNIPKERFEFQMLYGMRNQLQKDLLQEGYTVRVYLPYGEDWYGYFMRRLAERPANIAFALKGVFSK